MESLKCKVESGSGMVQRSKAYDETARYHCGLSAEDLIGDGFQSLAWCYRC